MFFHVRKCSYTSLLITLSLGFFFCLFVFCLLFKDFIILILAIQANLLNSISPQLFVLLSIRNK